MTNLRFKSTDLFDFTLSLLKAAEEEVNFLKGVE